MAANSTDYKLNIAPLTLSNIPPADTILDVAQKLIAESEQWKRGKKVGAVQTIVKPKSKDDLAPWHGRLSFHKPDEISFDELWDALGIDRGTKEAHFVPEIKKATLLRTLDDARFSLWSMLYVFPPPLTPRVFTVLHFIERTVPDSEFVVVQIPIDVSAEPELARLDSHVDEGVAHVVKARYASFERVRKLEDGSVEWLMATSSNAGGNIPQFIQDMSVPSSIAQDVPRLMNWVKTNRPANA